MRVHGAFFDEGIIFWCCNLFPAFLRGWPSSKGGCHEYSPFQDENRGPKHGCRLRGTGIGPTGKARKRPATHILPTTR